MQASFVFAGLGPERVPACAASLGFAPEGRVQQLNSLENRVFSLTLAEGVPLRTVGGQERPSRPGEGVVVKFYRPGRWSIGQLREEHRFLADLVAAGFPVCAPFELADGDPECPSLGRFEDYHVAVWPQEPGRIPDEFNDAMRVAFGRLLGRLHGIGASRPAPERQSLDGDTFIREPIEFLAGRGLVPARYRDRYFGFAREAAEALDRELAGLPRQRIHGDCHWGNLLARGDELRFLDFDDFVVGPAVQDIWMIAPAVDEAGLRERDLVLSGYREVREFDSAWLSAVAPLRAARFVYFAAWIGRRYDDEAFRRTFPQFGGDEYWETETQDLENLVRRDFAAEFREERQIEATEDYSKLTNKDYFYDL